MTQAACATELLARTQPRHPSVPLLCAQPLFPSNLWNMGADKPGSRSADLLDKAGNAFDEKVPALSLPSRPTRELTVVHAAAVHAAY